MARRTTKPVQKTVHKSAPKRIVRTIRTSNHYLKLFLMGVLIFLLGAVSAYRFLQRIPVNNLESDLPSNQIPINASIQPSASPSMEFYPSTVPSSSPTNSPALIPTKPAVPSPAPQHDITPLLPSQFDAQQSSPAVAPSKPAIKPSVLPSNQTTYVVKKGDSLWKIAQATTGNPYNWVKIYKQNNLLIGKNPGHILPGQVLTIET